ncbi:AcrVA2 family anti-CRISPR protein [Marinivivus vitaminiproducens]|uniref:AcrVA2 family anti-CRISPR protein n=1 Tax=Marinivivus vitaminiproducens TaxID=3035935 RepID=UPI0027A07046|nr:hypothetical protein P4R82_10670 [Geminicoccaceae bacterium SCSIO 64248]
MLPDASRPLGHLNAVMRRYPRLPNQVETMRAARGVRLPRWPDWCFLPMKGWQAIVQGPGAAPRIDLAAGREVGLVAALGTWRYSQGIYRFDPDVLAALNTSGMAGRLPVDVLQRLPEWCVYVETPGRTWHGRALFGFWAHLAWHDATDGRRLQFVFDCDGGLDSMPVLLGDWSVSDAVQRTLSEVVAYARRLGKRTVEADEASMRAVANELRPLIGLLLYMCSEAPEIIDRTEPGAYPGRPKTVKTKRGWRLFPPSRPRIWTVGAEIGRRLREAQTVMSEATGRTVRPHLRRAHWHGYWSGPRTGGTRRFTYHWIYPMLVGMDDRQNDEPEASV